MKDKHELIRKIEEECLLVNSYDMFSMRLLVSSYMKDTKTMLDSTEWLYLIDELWFELRYIRTQFDGIEEFEFGLRDGI